MTPKEREVMELALEALEQTQNEGYNLPGSAIREAITAIKEALAQQCVCGEPDSAGTHRTDGPCFAPQRTWVGLTKKDMDWLHENTPCIEGNYGYRFIKAIEAKLKEKNTK